jgi:hypothetical protein
VQYKENDKNTYNDFFIRDIFAIQNKIYILWRPTSFEAHIHCTLICLNGESELSQTFNVQLIVVVVVVVVEVIKQLSVVLMFKNFSFSSIVNDKCCYRSNQDKD